MALQWDHEAEVMDRIFIVPGVMQSRKMILSVDEFKMTSQPGPATSGGK